MNEGIRFSRTKSVFRPLASKRRCPATKHILADTAFVTSPHGFLVAVKLLLVRKFVQKRMRHKRLQLDRCASAPRCDNVPDGVLFIMLKRALLNRMLLPLLLLLFLPTILLAGPTNAIFCSLR